MINCGNYSSLRSKLALLDPADAAWFLGELEESEWVPFFRLLPKETAAEAFSQLEPDEQQVLVEGFTDRELQAVLSELYADDAADLVEEMPANVVKRILRHTDPQKRAVINQLLNYPKDSAGSIMTTEFMDLKPQMTVAQAFERIRKVGLERETVYTCYVTDQNRRLEGVVTILELLIASTEETIGALMNRDVIHFNTHDDREAVARAFDKYDFLAFPVADGEGRLVGIVTVDDAMEVLVEEDTEDIEKMAAILPTDKSYLKTGVFETFKKRIPWLLILMISATFTGRIIAGFEAALAAQAVLISFIPMLMDTAGNTGSQSSVTVIRSLSLNELQFKDLFRVAWKEVRVAVLCGLALAVANFLKIILIDNLLFDAQISIVVAVVVCLTLCCTVLVAKTVGCVLPMVAKKLRFDPAVMASPFITTIVDAIALLIYFAIAIILLKI
ncbi:MAG: magnesium transporter [Alphaproteobacteria bacterium]|nr:magnesium transporter [Alphaproteobacteria bacterium]